MGAFYSWLSGSENEERVSIPLLNSLEIDISIPTHQLTELVSTKKVGIPEYLASQHEEIEWQIQNSLKYIEEKNEVVKGLKQLSLDGNLEQVRRHCEELWKSRWNHNEICDYLQEQLNVTFNMRDENVRRYELDYVIFYYLIKDGEPDEHIQKLIHRLYDPLYEHTWSRNNYTWFKLCCEVLGFYRNKVFSQLYKLLNYNTDALKYLLYKHSKLLLCEEPRLRLAELFTLLQHKDIHEILKCLRDANGETCMFHLLRTDFHLCIQLYIEHIDELYELLSIRNTNGQTALHVNTRYITSLLADIYTPKQRDSLFKLASITDNQNNTALKVSDKWSRNKLMSLLNRVDNNEYIMDGRADHNILIIYNSRNRLGAWEEAKTIHNACRSAYSNSNIRLEKNKPANDFIKIVRETADTMDPLGLPFKSLIVILASHGNLGTIDDCHGKPIRLSEIEDAMCSDILDGKPKMLITQCCQIGMESAKTPPYVPTHDDFCAVMSCVSGQASQRGVFLMKLSKQFRNSSRDTNIYQLINNVCNEMERERYEQTPIIMSTLKAEYRPADRWDEFNKLPPDMD